MNKWVARTLGVLALLLIGSVGVVGWALWSWAHPPKHHITQGTFEDLVPIGATKEELLRNPALRIYGTDAHVQWKWTTEMNPSEVALLMKDKAWGLEAGAPTCRGTGNCPGTYIRFKDNVVSEVEVTCHECP